MRDRRNDRTATLRTPPNPPIDSECRQSRDRWLARNATAVKAYNAMVAELGVFSDALRRF